MQDRQSARPHGEESPRTLFIFPSSREEVLSGVQAGQAADTPLRGMNHIAGAEHLTIAPQSLRAAVLIPRLLRYDRIVAQDNLLLGYAVSVCARVCRLKTRWFYVAMTSSTLMRRHTLHPVRLFLLKMFWRSYARIICISSEQLEDFAQLGIPRTNLAFVPFGVDAQFFQPASISREEDVIASVGRDPGRDYGTLFKAAERVNRAFVVVAGHKNIPHGMPVPANVSVLYNLDIAEIRDLYARARLVVVASKDASQPDGSDCSGQTVVLDALAAGKAVIATHRSWIADYFVPGQDLVVVEPNDPEALARAIEALLNDEEKRKQLAASGHAKVTARYTTKTFADALTTLMDPLTN